MGCNACGIAVNLTQRALRPGNLSCYLRISTLLADLHRVHLGGIVICGYQTSFRPTEQVTVVAFRERRLSFTYFRRPPGIDQPAVYRIGPVSTDIREEPFESEIEIAIDTVHDYNS